VGMVEGMLCSGLIPSFSVITDTLPNPPWLSQNWDDAFAAATVH
jgi:hypothetical protein